MFFVFIYKRLSVCPHPLLLPLPQGEGEGIRKSDEVCYSIIFFQETVHSVVTSFVTRHSSFVITNLGFVLQFR